MTVFYEHFIFLFSGENVFETSIKELYASQQLQPCQVQRQRFNNDIFIK